MSVVKIRKITDFSAAIKGVKSVKEAKSVILSASQQAVRGYCARQCDQYEKSMNANEIFDLVLEQVEKDLAFRMENMTGFGAYKRTGEEFLAGEMSKEQLLEQFSSASRGPEYWGMAYGLSIAFGISIEGKKYEELLSEIHEFITNAQEVAPTSDTDYAEGIELANQLLKGEISKEVLQQIVGANQDRTHLLMGMARGFGYCEGWKAEDFLPVIKKFIEEYAQELDDPEVGEGQDLAHEFLRHEISGQEFCQTVREKFTKAFLIGICSVFELDTEDCDIDELSRMVHEYVDMSLKKIPRTTYPPHKTDTSEKICNSTYKKRLRNFTEIKEVI